MKQPFAIFILTLFALAAQAQPWVNRYAETSNTCSGVKVAVDDGYLSFGGTYYKFTSDPDTWSLCAAVTLPI